MEWDQFFWPHTVLVEVVTAGAAGGPTTAAPRRLGAEVTDEQQMVRGSDAEEVLSSTGVTLPLDVVVPIGSFVTVWPDNPERRRRAEVLAVVVNDNDDDPLLESSQVLRLN